MTARSAIRTGRTLWRVYRHRRAGHVLIVDPGAVTCSTCVKAKAPRCSCRHAFVDHGETRGCRQCDCSLTWWAAEMEASQVAPSWPPDCCRECDPPCVVR